MADPEDFWTIDALKLGYGLEIEVRVAALDRNGEPFEEDLDGLHAICLQHEMDHLEGKLFVDYLSPLKRRMALKKLEKTRKQAEQDALKARL